ncbi:MAG TPA: bifunctional UDP-N-acetylmuramoyl-tripeptide:D-alanyl-D-alanine ligase/alanine racemase [Cyclobacteriaceae bacterium]|nr:bifunctional UDP-N-acetylmuramoyl-tripeptide:D-alanyl-D-alanine ligase/alanine racemase [Cyclobacteriaceae bacterium]
MISFSKLPSVTTGAIAQSKEDRAINSFLTDSRKSTNTDSCFVAIKGERHDGHAYIKELYASGVRMFIVEKELDWTSFPEASFFRVSSGLHALQDIAVHHRSLFKYPVIGITGSNGKTIVKEWIYQLLAPQYRIVKNPGSYNSQLGVPLSVLKMQPHHELGVFEAGISMPGEMSRLQRIIQPTIGIFTNIGSAHDAGFRDREQKVREKLELFRDSKVLIYCHDHEDVRKEIEQLSATAKILDWGENPSATIRVVDNEDGSIKVTFERANHFFTAPFIDTASRENLVHCIILMLHLKISDGVIQEGINSLKSVPMRLELKQGVNQSLIIDDTYNNDLAGLQISLDFLAGQQKQKKALILSDILQSGLSDADLVKEIAGAVLRAGVNIFVGIGPVLLTHEPYFRGIHETSFYPNTDAFLADLDTDAFQSSVILVKGARPFRFESIVQRVQRKVHGTVMEVDLSCVIHNLNYFKSLLKPGVKMMVMVKAFAYGSGSEEVANLLQYHRVDYLGVAYADEGIELRKNRISLPIMVMNPSEESFPSLLEYQLEPEIYSLKILRAFVRFLGRRSCKVHIKIDSGMHRLGFEENDMEELISILKSHRGLTIASVFSHLVGSDDAEHDAFSKEQVDIFSKRCEQLSTAIQQRPLRHVLNSPGILRFPQYQFEMVRLGIGLYGVDPTTENKKTDLQPVATLKTMISQIRTVPAGQSIGYGRKGKASSNMSVATIAIGYADGFSRAFSSGVGEVLVNGKRAPVVGNVCMDMTMIDVTDIDAREGDEVIIFGKELPIAEVAQKIGTIPYEILTSTSERVKRVFHAESI